MSECAFHPPVLTDSCFHICFYKYYKQLHHPFICSYMCNWNCQLAFILIHPADASIQKRFPSMPQYNPSTGADMKSTA